MKLLIFVAALFFSEWCSASKLQPPLRLWYDHQAQYFEESLPIGNGKLGALVYGGTDDNIIYLNDITLWTGKPVDHEEGAGASKWIPIIREALFNEDYARADSLQKYVEGHNSAFYQPLGTLHIKDLSLGAVSDYHRQLDLDSALVSDSYLRDGHRITREYLASNPDRLIAIRLRGDIHCRLALTAQVPHKVKSRGKQLTMTGHAVGDPNESIHFCTILNVVTDGLVTASDSSLTISNTHEAIVYIVNATSYNGPDKHPVSEGAPYLEQAADDSWHTVNVTYDEVRLRHIADYRKYYDRVKLCLDAPTDVNVPTDRQVKERLNDRYLEMLYFQYGRYLLIVSSRTKGVPANLQGLWTHRLWSPWRGNYTMNINLEENYWPAFVANLEEMAEPLDDFIKALAQNGRYTAHHFYGVEKGWCASHNSDIWAMTNPVGEHVESPMWSCWNMGGAWLIQTLWERYLFTRDEKYLRQTAYPLMKGAADFCLNWLVEHNGELLTAPATSPENEYITNQGYHGVTCYGATADLAIIRQLLLDVIAAGKRLGERTAPYQRALQRLHPYTIGQEGDLNEWYHDWADTDPKHRHQSHLIGLFPGRHLTDAQLQAAAEKSLLQRGDESTGWSTGWRINLWARLHNGEKAYLLLHNLLTFTDPEDDRRPGTRHMGGTYANLLDAHPPFQIDGNFGGTAGICEMLMQSDGETIELLPACPPQWDSGAVSGLCARGGYEVSFEWKGRKVRSASIKARQKGTVTLKYNQQQKTFTLKAGQTMPIKTW